MVSTLELGSRRPATRPGLVNALCSWARRFTLTQPRSQDLSSSRLLERGGRKMRDPGTKLYSHSASLKGDASHGSLSLSHAWVYVLVLVLFATTLLHL